MTESPSGKVSSYGRLSQQRSVNCIANSVPLLQLTATGCWVWNTGSLSIVELSSTVMEKIGYMLKVTLLKMAKCKPFLISITIHCILLICIDIYWEALTY